jgi:transglutaminase-like putative cysteine protease
VRLAVDHETLYRYEDAVRSVTQVLRLTPRDTARQRVHEWRLETPGHPVRTLDGYGNVLHVLTLDTPTREIRLRAVGVVETRDGSDAAEETLPPLVFLRPTPLTRVDETLADFAERHRRGARSGEGLRGLAETILERMPFQVGRTVVSSSSAEAFALGSGVCQDHAHVFIACCRYLGIPARYVSGYVFSPALAGSPVASHAWAEAWVVDRWRSFDVANGGAAGELHVRLAVGADYHDACPVRGVRTGGGAERLEAGARMRQVQAQQ